MIQLIAFLINYCIMLMILFLVIIIVINIKVFPVVSRYNWLKFFIIRKTFRDSIYKVSKFENILEDLHSDNTIKNILNLLEEEGLIAASEFSKSREQLFRIMHKHFFPVDPILTLQNIKMTEGEAKDYLSFIFLGIKKIFIDSLLIDSNLIKNSGCTDNIAKEISKEIFYNLFPNEITLFRTADDMYVKSSSEA